MSGRRTAWIGMLMIGLAGPVMAEEMVLRTGRVIYGEVLGVDQERLRVRRYEDGGLFELRWEHLAPPDARRLRSAFGLDVDAEREELETEAFRVVYAGGEEFIGLIAEEDVDRVVLRQRGGTRLPLRRAGIELMERVRVPLTEIFTLEEIYAQRLGEIDLDSAEDHFELALFLKKVGAFEQAREHFLKVGEMDPGLRAAERSLHLAALEELIANQGMRDAFDAILRRVAIHQYDLAFEELDRFEAAYPDSPLAGELKARRVEFENARSDYVRSRTVKLWYRIVKSVADRKSRDRDLVLEDARSFAQSDMGTAVAEEIAKLLTGTGLRVDPDEVSGAWRDPKAWEARRLAPIQRATYGHGTFLLGQKALLTYEKPEEPEEPKEEEKEGTRPSDSFRERLKQVLDKQQTQVRGPKEAGAEPEQWWAQAVSRQKSQWLRAFYAEFSGDMVVVRVEFRLCEDCGGRGYKEVLAGAPGAAQGSRGGQAQSGGGIQRVVCETCKSLAKERVVVYR